jgi:hypothetical protein
MLQETKAVVVHGLGCVWYLLILFSDGEQSYEVTAVREIVLLMIDNCFILEVGTMQDHGNKSKQ